MKKNKSTYITDLTSEILTNKILLDEWAEFSKDMDFLELSTEILSDIDLLFSWDCNNVLNLKLAGVLSKGQNFELSSGMVIQLDESYRFPMKPFLYKMSIKAMIRKKVIEKIIKEDLISQGNSLEQVENAERIVRMTNLLRSVQQMDKYSLRSQLVLFLKLIPEAIYRLKEDSNNFYKKKADEFLLPINENTNNDESVALDLAKSTNLEKEKNPFPLLFTTTEVYNCFLEYQKYIVDFYIDYSYLKKRLEIEKLIHNHKDNEFMKIVFEQIKVVNDRDYQKYFVEGKLRSLDKSHSTQRENNFNIVFDTILNPI
ncbi:hypothetical protein [Flavobacterium frigoris]|uniref:Uncharacterized protein n=1 Tax=Flavobacterium frigoris TaxID=229204 RepID=A0A1H9LYG8_FLAFI|nr:hypothetical protein [Flavobacterium frigoris]SER16247.1 hypothetical protein SAMN05444355_107179 [Flavobacterium frigoris]